MPERAVSRSPSPQTWRYYWSTFDGLSWQKNWFPVTRKWLFQRMWKDSQQQLHNAEDHLEFACTDLAEKAKTFNLTVTSLHVSTLLCESRLQFHFMILLPMHYSVGRSFPCSSFWIRAGPKRFLAPRNAFFVMETCSTCADRQ